MKSSALQTESWMGYSPKDGERFELGIGCQEVWARLVQTKPREEKEEEKGAGVGGGGFSEGWEVELGVWGCGALGWELWVALWSWEVGGGGFRG